MSITYTWNVKALNVTSATSIQDTALDQVVNEVTFEREGHDTSTGLNYTAKGVINLATDNISDSDFQPYSDLTPTVIEGWIEANTDSDQKSEFESKIQALINISNLAMEVDAAMANSQPPLPWESLEEADSA
jgi:hypothetical protein